MSPKLALKILIILIIVAAITVFSFFILNKFFLNVFNKGESINGITNIINEDKKDIEIEAYPEEERRETAVKEIRKVEEEMTKKDLEDDGLISSTTAKSIEDMINEEIRKQKESGL